MARIVYFRARRAFQQTAPTHKNVRRSIPIARLVVRLVVFGAASRGSSCAFVDVNLEHSPPVGSRV